MKCSLQKLFDRGIFFSLILIFCLLLELSRASDSEEGESEKFVVKVANGKISGSRGFSVYSKRPFYQFKGIPYAKPPVSSLRWRAPQEAESWDGILDTTKYAAICPQLSETTNDVVEGDENCLFANVFTPSIKENNEEQYPVVILIHGGSFQYESGGHYSPDYLLEESMVLVTFNYRLGILGFLSTGMDGVIQGNAGLKDQVLLMKWVRDNIRTFNGNPDKVTIMGLSSGSAAVHLHMLSPMSEGLFHQAISQSGTAFCPWAIVQKPAQRVGKIANLLNCSRSTREEVKHCLMQIDAHSLIDKSSAFGEWYIDPIVPVGPVIERDGQDPIFLPDAPYRLIDQGKFRKNIPWLLGVNAQEGLLHSADIVNNGILVRVLNLEWNQAAPITLLYKYTSMDANVTSGIILDYYFKGQRISSNNLENLTNMYSDRYFFYGTHRTVKAHVQNGAESPIYLYYFDYMGDFSLIHLNQRNLDIQGVSHYDQAQYLFQVDGFPVITEKHHKFSKRFISTLFNFVQSGKPGYQGDANEWRAVELKDLEEEESLKYNVIGSTDQTTIIDEPFKDRMSFWDDLLLLELEKEVDMAYIESLRKVTSNTKTEL